MKQVVALALQAARAATHFLAAEGAEGIRNAAFSSSRKVVPVVVQIPGNKQVETPIAVIVAPGGAGVPSSRIVQGHARLVGHIGKCPIVIVVKEAVLSPVGDEDIGPAVVVIICDGYAEAPAIVGDAGLGRHVRKRSVMVVMKQRGMRRGLLAVERVEGRAVHDIDIEPSVVVIVDQPHARALCFHDVGFRGRAHFVGPFGQPGFLRDIFKDDRSALHKSPRGDGAVLLVQLHGMGRAGFLASRLPAHPRAISPPLATKLLAPLRFVQWRLLELPPQEFPTRQR